MDWKGKLILDIVRDVKSLFGSENYPKCKFGGTRKDWILINDLTKLEPPVMIVWGKWDPYLPVSQAILANKLIKRSCLYVFSKSGHAPQRSDPNRFHDVAYRFLTE
jgi:pimeloyl-ACP methyl ester carboxylesterase